MQKQTIQFDIHVHTSFLEDEGEQGAIEIIRKELEARAEQYVQRFHAGYTVGEGRFEVILDNPDLKAPDFPEGGCTVRGVFEVTAE